MASKTRIALENWLKTIDVNGKKIIDLGGRQRGLIGRVKGEPRIYDVLDLPEYDLNIVQSVKYNYDCAFMIEVSEYLYQPVIAVRNINRLLKKGGIFYSSWHMVYCQHLPQNKDYLRYTPDGVEKIIKEGGFEMIEHEPRTTENDLLTMFYEQDKMHLGKEYNHKQIGSIIKAKKMQEM